MTEMAGAPDESRADARGDERHRAAAGADDLSMGQIVDQLPDALLVGTPVRSPDGAVVDFTLTYANEATAVLAGVPLDELLDRSMLELFPWLPDSPYFERFVEVVESNSVQKMEISRMEGEDLVSALGVSASPHAGGIVLVIRDVTDWVAKVERFRQAASHDPLTGLANRSVLVDEIRRAMSSAERSGAHTAVLLADIDHFKRVNDSLGHAAGDRLLCEAADRLRATVRGSDLVARQGGDEFVVVMREVAKLSEGVHVAERLLEMFREPFELGGASVMCTLSVGLAFSDSIHRSPESLLRDADTAMYDAKASGRDRFSCFDDSLNEANQERRRMEDALRNALERDEFEVYFQPEIDLATGVVGGVEALLRWHHPSGEVYEASRFVEVAEETGAILSIGAWAIRSACEQLMRWIEADPSEQLMMSVNVSALQLAERHLIGALDEALRVTGLDPTRLAVEVPESALLTDNETTRTNLTDLHQRGVRLVLDNFGAGTASLSALLSAPFDRLKLDRSVLATAPADGGRLLRGVLALADRLGLPVVAEGVESAEQVEQLRELGCTWAQGFWYSPAVPADQVHGIGPLGG